jgi:hypothetical protein
MNRTFAALDAQRQAALRTDLLSLIGSRNLARDGTAVVPSDYLEAVVERV